MTNNVKEWFSAFRLEDIELRLNMGRPLYSYQVALNEYQSLEKILKNHKRDAFNPTFSDSWSACFCLYVAETFRREYPAKAGWSWDLIWSRLGYELSVPEYQKLVERGLKLWKRPFLKDARGRNFLGTLFAEGGLPWRLVQSDSHGFGIIVRRGLSGYYVSKATGQPLTALIAEVEYRLPLTFQTLETRLLLAGIVEQLISLVSCHPLQNKDDPASYLDEKQPAWRGGFPIPLDEENARTLINGWLKDADEQHQKHQKEVPIEDIYCTHTLIDSSNQLNVLTTVYLPNQFSIQLKNIDNLSSWRFEMAFYEGDHFIKRAGAAYGEFDQENQKVNLNITTSKFEIQRRVLTDNLQLRFLENGVLYSSELIEQSALDQDHSPLVFERKNDEWLFVAQASCRITGDIARLCLPESSIVVDDEGFEVAESVVYKLDSGIRWIEISESIVIRDGADQYAVRLRQEIKDAVLRLSGRLSLYETVPSTVYYGLAKLVPNELLPKDLIQEVNGISLQNFARDRNIGVGIIRYRVLNSQKETLLQRRYGVLPVDFEVKSYPAINSQRARLVIAGINELPISILASAIRWEREVNAQGLLEVILTPLGEELPTHLTLYVGNPNSGISINLPYPSEGAYLLDSEQHRVINKELTIGELLGMRLVLATAQNNINGLSITLSLIGAKVKLQRNYLQRAKGTVELSLLSFEDDIIQLLSAVDDQDVYVRFSVECNGRQLHQFNIRRYQTILVLKNQHTLEVHQSNSTSLQTSVLLSAMRLDDPKHYPVQIIEKHSQGVGTGEYEIPADLARNGPWLIYSMGESEVKCRPYLHVTQNDNPADVDIKNVTSLHNATQLFHPIDSPNVIDDQISNMAKDLNHSGWQYLADLVKGYAQLPLSTFEAWKSLANQPQALALALFRLDLDVAFCERIQNELAVLWETIHVSQWTIAYQNYRAWLSLKCTEEVVLIVINNREQTLQSAVSGFVHINNYLRDPQPDNLKKVPIQFLSFWYEELRRQYMHDEQWPINLNEPLKKWMSNQNIPNQIKNLSKVEYTDTVAYLPIYMAYVSLGLARLEDLSVPISSLKFEIKRIADFDRMKWYAPAHAVMVNYLLSNS